MLARFESSDRQITMIVIWRGDNHQLDPVISQQVCGVGHRHVRVQLPELADSLLVARGNGNELEIGRSIYERRMRHTRQTEAD